MLAARSPRIRSCAALVTAALLGLGAGAPVFAVEDAATLVGTLLDPAGKPARGLRTVLQNVDTGKEFFTDPTDRDGAYTLTVPVGARYRIVGAVAPDGTRMPILATTPFPVDAPGRYRLPDVMFRIAEEPDTPSPDPAPRPSASPPVKRPWYKSPGGVIGIVAGGVAVIAGVSGGGSDDPPPPASPSSP